MNNKISWNSIKLLGIVSMFLDHYAAIIIFHNSLSLDGISIPLSVIGISFRIIGRLAFIIFSYSIVEGFVHTHNIFLYAFRLLILAIISEIPFNLAFYNKLLYFEHQNTIFTLLLGLIAIKCLDLFSKLENNKLLFSIISILSCSFFAEFLHLDYGFFGILFIISLYIFRNNKKQQYIISSIPLLFCGIGQIIGTVAFIPISKNNGKYNKKFKYIFYLFYPLHLFFLYFVSKYLFN